MELSTNDYEPSAKDGGRCDCGLALSVSPPFSREVTREESRDHDTQNPHKLLKTRDETGKVKMYPAP